MKAVASAAPKKALTIVTCSETAGKKIIASARPKLAPALMPRMDGLASGLFVTPCMRAPATAKLTPQTSAAKRRGRRSVQTTRSDGS